MGVHFQLPPHNNPWQVAPKPYSPPLWKYTPPQPPDGGSKGYFGPGDPLPGIATKDPEPEYIGDPGREIGKILPELFSYDTSCPTETLKCVDRRVNLYQMIQHLNDEHRWTREAIADWLETLPVDLTFKRGDTDDVEDPGDQSG